MRRLFVRVFVSFWIAMMLILLSAMAITATVSWQRFSKLTTIAPGRLIDEAAVTLHDHGAPGLTQWLRTTASKHPELDVYVLDPKGADLLHRPIPKRIQPWLVLSGAPLQPGASPRTDNWPYGYDLAPHGVTAHRLAFNRSHLLANPVLRAPDGAAYRLVVAWLGGTPIDALGADGLIPLLFLIAVAASAAVSWWLAVYIARPVAKLQLSARALALGALDAEVEGQFCRRKDELGVLARDFNEMAARLRSQIASKELLIRDISHELRSPLTRLRVALALAQQGEGDIAVQLERIERDIERLDALIEDTLQFSRLSSQAPPFVREEIELDVLLQDVVADAELEAIASDKQIQLRDIPPLNVSGNAALFRRALDNVLRNAVRFTPAGSSVEVSLRQRPEKLSIEIRDHGPGVPEQDRQRIFEAFYRVTQARDRISGGAGLGLAITARIMALHGGQSEARNAPGGGLIVELTIPARFVTAERPVERPGASGPSAIIGEGRKRQVGGPPAA